MIILGPESNKTKYGYPQIMVETRSKEGHLNILIIVVAHQNQNFLKGILIKPNFNPILCQRIP